MTRRSFRLAASVIGATVLIGCSTTSVPAARPLNGYLDEVALTYVANAVTAPPPPGSEAETVDVVVSERIKALEGTERWWLATLHAELRPPLAAQHFDCVLGTRLAQTSRPALSRLMGRLLVDAERLTVDMSVRHPRLRPVALDPARAACQRLTAEARMAPASYPALGAVLGAAYGEMFADLVPEQAQALRHAGAEIGISRAVCATNWPSDVSAGEALGVALYKAAAEKPGFGGDLEAARAEVAAAQAEGRANPSCAAERRALRLAGPVLDK